MSHVVVWFDSEYSHCSVNQIQPGQGAAALSPGPAPEGVCGHGGRGAGAVWGEQEWVCLGCFHYTE